jgi:hypothetical protein
VTVTPTAHRPVLVTVVVVLVILSGISAALSAWVSLAASGGVVWRGIALIVVALVYFAVAKGLLDGNPTARFVTAAMAVIQIVLAIVWNASFTSSEGVARGGSILLPVLVLIFLFTPKANAFFGSRR